MSEKLNGHLLPLVLTLPLSVLIGLVGASITTTMYAQEAVEVVSDESIAAYQDPSFSGEVSVVEEETDVVVCDAAISFGDWLGYNAKQDDLTWLVGDDFGLFSLESFPTLEVGQKSDVVLGFGLHFLDGPRQTDLPPRLYDFRLAFHTRKAVSDSTIFDLNLGVGAFSDFEGSSRHGIRFPGHAVAYHAWTPRFVSVLGVESFDRDDISVLPVAGIVWRPDDDFICELIFPRPKLSVQLDGGRTLYISGEVGGGTWAVERVDRTDDNVTYGDLRVAVGIQDSNDRDGSVLEIGWAFDRLLEYRSGRGDYEPDDAFVIRVRTFF